MTFSGCRFQTSLPTSAAHLLQQHGKVGHESKDAPIPDGAFRYRSDAEHLHASWGGGCRRGIKAGGRTGRCQKGTGKGQG